MGHHGREEVRVLVEDASTVVLRHTMWEEETEDWRFVYDLDIRVTLM